MKNSIFFNPLCLTLCHPPTSLNTLTIYRSPILRVMVMLVQGFHYYPYSDAKLMQIRALSMPVLTIYKYIPNLGQKSEQNALHGGKTKRGVPSRPPSGKER